MLEISKVLSCEILFFDKFKTLIESGRTFYSKISLLKNAKKNFETSLILLLDKFKSSNSGKKHMGKFFI